MHCLLVAATPFEIAPFTDHLGLTEKLDHIDMEIDILVTGVGNMAATYALSRYLQHRKPDLVIQAGVAGAFDPEIAIGSVFAVKQDVVADQGVQEKDGFWDVFDLSLASPGELPYRKGVLPNPYTNLIRRTRLKKAIGITVNEISTSKKRIAAHAEKYQAQLESMEGAALHYTCLMEHVTFLQLRAVSNYIGDRNKKNWNMPLAIGNLNKELIRLLESL
ncbi:futalosine hydrolase [Flavihumibacter petaseus]|uniref:Futalosine hydrolase n=1 Tax=Flavihumibacter petaseus NBRC 106054 TaxID=1220578 RepID=A0A0E9N867_9BACT|nr:futalosine hydrolase [Flavihumibacter petaseus]GAO45575.1 putative nucleosidase [Flavihumibacter petaseus NBRC 106054]